MGSPLAVSVNRCSVPALMFQNGFYSLMVIAKENNLPWVDCQLVNEHLLSLGACTVSRQDYLKSLQDVIIQPTIDWKSIRACIFK